MQDSSLGANLKDNLALVVEDVPENATLLAFELEDSGFEVDIAGDGEEALGKIEQRSYAVILLDIHMPGVDGIETLTRFKQAYPDSTTAVIMVTAEDEDASLEQCLDLGAHDYIRKPINFKELHARVRSALRVRHAIELVRVSEQKLIEANKELAELAAMDVLSGCYNRRYFFDLVDKELSRTRRYNKIFTVLMVDIDHFKRINDNYGHAAGDEIIAWLGSVLSESFRKSDIVGRIGGEEFAVCCIDCDAANAFLLGERIRQECMQTVHDKIAKDLVVTISVGIAQYRPEDTQFASVLDRADKQLYTAKRSGRNRCCVNNDPID